MSVVGRADLERLTHDVAQLRRGGDSLLVTSLVDGFGNPPTGPLLAVRVDQVRQIPLGEPIHQVGGRGLGAKIDSHVQRSFLIEGQAARRVSELVAAESEIREDPIYFRPANSVQHFLDVLEVLMVQSDSLCLAETFLS